MASSLKGHQDSIPKGDTRTPKETVIWTDAQTEVEENHVKTRWFYCERQRDLKRKRRRGFLLLKEKNGNTQAATRGGKTQNYQKISAIWAPLISFKVNLDDKEQTERKTQRYAEARARLPYEVDFLQRVILKAASIWSIYIYHYLSISLLTLFLWELALLSVVRWFHFVTGRLSDLFSDFGGFGSDRCQVSAQGAQPLCAEWQCEEAIGCHLDAITTHCDILSNISKSENRRKSIESSGGSDFQFLVWILLDGCVSWLHVHHVIAWLCLSCRWGISGQVECLDFLIEETLWQSLALVQLDDVPSKAFEATHVGLSKDLYFSQTLQSC